MGPIQTLLTCLLVSAFVVSLAAETGWAEPPPASSEHETVEAGATQTSEAVGGTVNASDAELLGDLAAVETIAELAALDDGADSLDRELAMFEDMPVVISASRQAQPINMLSVPVSIVTADDIHYSGQTSITDFLTFVPGMDVLASDRNNASVGIRGLHHTFADRTLVLVDGRNAGGPVTGGADFFRLPILPEDIDRIEVVRGPGGAAWGANAFNGVINFIMKEPEDVLGLFASTTVNEYGDTFTHLRWGHEAGDWSWRVSGGYEDRESSDDAVDGDMFFSTDFARNWRFDGEAIYRASKDTKISIGAGASNVERGDFEFAGFPMAAAGDPRRNERLDLIRTHARIDHSFDKDTSGYLQWYGDYEHIDRPSFLQYRAFENDFEGQLNLVVGESHHMSLGGNFRWTHIKAIADRSTDLFADDSADEYWVGVFLIDRWEAAERLTIETQARVDWYSETTTDWSGRLSALYALDEDKQHIVRLSGAKAFRSPLYGIRQVAGGRMPLGPPGMFGLNLIKAGDLGNEQIWSFEGGYQGRMTPELTLRADAFIQIYRDLIGGRALPDPLGFGRSFIQLANIDGGEAVGTEVELAYKKDNFEIAAWYAFHDFATTQERQSIRAFRPAQHKAGVRSRLFLPDDWAVNLNYRYTDTTPNEPSTLPGNTDIPSFHRLDLTLSKAFADNAAEVLVGVTDVLDDTDQPVTQVGSITSHDTPGRTFFCRLQLKF